MGDEQAQLLEWFEQSRREFLAAIDAVTDRQWQWKPAPDRWSVGEIAEHVVAAEALLFASVGKALSGPPHPDWEAVTSGKTEFITQVMAARVGRAVSPDPLVPREGLTPAQVSQRFERQRVEIVRFAAETPPDAMKRHTARHPFPRFNDLSAWQWLIYVPLHTLRHEKQIAEVKATPGYPLD